MASELSINVTSVLKNGDLSDQIKLGARSFDQATKSAKSFTVTAGADAALDLSGISTFGWLHLVNLDHTDAIDYGPEIVSGAPPVSAMAPFGRIKPREVHAVRLNPGITVRIAAVAGSPKLDVHLWAD
jgi:hypothetical protein